MRRQLPSGSRPNARWERCAVAAGPCLDAGFVVFPDKVDRITTFHAERHGGRSPRGIAWAVDLESRDRRKAFDRPGRQTTAPRGHPVHRLLDQGALEQSWSNGGTDSRSVCLAYSTPTPKGAASCGTTTTGSDVKRLHVDEAARHELRTVDAPVQWTAQSQRYSSRAGGR